MSLKSLLNNKVNDSFPSRDVTGGARIMRVMKFKKFTWDEPGDWTRFEELLDSIDASDIVRIQFSGDLRGVAIVWTQEVRHTQRKEYDAQLPAEVQESTPLFPCELTDHVKTYAQCHMSEEEQRDRNHELLWLNSDKRWIKAEETPTTKTVTAEDLFNDNF